MRCAPNGLKLCWSVSRSASLEKTWYNTYRGSLAFLLPSEDVMNLVEANFTPAGLMSPPETACGGVLSVPIKNAPRKGIKQNGGGASSPGINAGAFAPQRW